MENKATLVKGIKAGRMDSLKKYLQTLDSELIDKLKKNKDDVRFLQGESYIIDQLLKILS